MKGAIQFFVVFIICILLGIVAGHGAGYVAMFLDEYEVDRTIR